jgi:hypothetical protein
MRQKEDRQTHIDTQRTDTPQRTDTRTDTPQRTDTRTDTPQRTDTRTDTPKRTDTRTDTPQRTDTRTDTQRTDTQRTDTSTDRQKKQTQKISVAVWTEGTAQHSTGGRGTRVPVLTLRTPLSFSCNRVASRRHWTALLLAALISETGTNRPACRWSVLTLNSPSVVSQLLLL